MMIKPGLMAWMFSRSVWVTLIAAGVAIPYVCLNREVFDWRFSGAYLFILLHCVVLAVIFGRCQSGSFGFLYTRGYSRDVLWAHAMLAMLVSALAVWIPVAVLIWSGLRSGLQDRMQSPSFPVMAPREYSSPIAWLAEYLLLLSVFQFAWIRWAQPTRGQMSGIIIAIAVVVGAGVAVDSLFRSGLILAWAASVLGLIAAFTCLIAGWRLHRTLEVQI